MRNGGHTEFEQMVKFYKDESAQPEEKIRALRAVGLTKDLQLIQKAIDFAMSEAVRSQDVHTLLGACASTAAGRDLTWNFLKKNWTPVLDKVAAGNFLLARIVSFVTQSFASSAKADEVEEFFKTHTLASIERTVSQSIESIRGNAQFLQNNLQETTAWLKQHA